MSIKKRVLALMCTGALLFAVPAHAASDEGSYAGQVKILDLDASDGEIQTTEIQKGDLNIGTDMDVEQYRLPVLYTEYWDGEETEIVQWTDKVYVHAGDVVVELKGASDEITLTQLKLQLTRSTESYDRQCSVYKEQIKNKKSEIAALSGTDKKIAQLELKKIESQYAQYQYDYAQSVASLKEQVNSLQSNQSGYVITAKQDGYLYIPNDDMRGKYKIGTVRKNQALFSIVKPGGCAFAMQENARGGTLRVGMTDTSCDAVVVCDSTMAVDYNLMTYAPILAYSPNALTKEVLESVCGVDPESRLRFSLAYLVPVCQDVIVLKTVQIFCSNDQVLSEKLEEQGRTVYDHAARYYVRTLDGGMEHKHMVQLGPIVDEYVVVLSGVQVGDQLVV